MHSEMRTLEFKLGKSAPSYERVHYVHHYLYNPNFTKDNLMPFAGKIEDAIYEETGYLAYLVDIQIKHFLGLYTDVDFIIDSPSASPIDPLTIAAILKAIAIVIAVIAILGIVVLLFITVWSEKYKIYYCDQHYPPKAYTGWQQYMAHLAAEHPKKYEAAKEAGGGDWWTKPIIAIGGLLILGLLAYGLVTRRREEERGRKP